MTSSDTSYRDHQYSRMLLVLGGFMAIAVGVAIGAVYGPAVRAVTWVLGAALLAWLLVRTRLDVEVTRSGLRIGTAAIDWQHLRLVEVLTDASMRAAITTDAHPNDFRRLRGTVTGLRAWLDDPSDPHRAWVASVRDPDALEAALRAVGAVEVRRAG